MDDKEYKTIILDLVKRANNDQLLDAKKRLLFQIQTKKLEPVNKPLAPAFSKDVQEIINQPIPDPAKLKLLRKRRLNKLHLELLADDWLYNGLIRALAQAKLMTEKQCYHWPALPWFKEYLQDRDEVMRDLQNLLPKGNKSQQFSLALLTGECLIHFLRFKHQDYFFPEQILRKVCNARQALDHQFPGYIENKLFYRLVLGEAK